MNILDRLCPECGDEMEVTENSINFHRVLHYGTCHSCMREFGRFADDLEWSEINESWYDYLDDIEI